MMTLAVPAERTAVTLSATTWPDPTSLQNRTYRASLDGSAD